MGLLESDVVAAAVGWAVMKLVGEQVFESKEHSLMINLDG